MPFGTMIPTWLVQLGTLLSVAVERRVEVRNCGPHALRSDAAPARGSAGMTTGAPLRFSLPKGLVCAGLEGVLEGAKISR